MPVSMVRSRRSSPVTALMTRIKGGGQVDVGSGVGWSDADVAALAVDAQGDGPGLAGEGVDDFDLEVVSEHDDVGSPAFV